MILIGFRTLTKHMGMLGTPSVCSRCGQSVQHEIIRDIFVLTLFFIPVLPVWRSFTLICPRCGEARRLKAREAKAMLDNGIRF
ncbi:MAG: zinc-ribbon domain-containing protein [Oscillospiraceae bacterium]|nr:zinc-ribbon domain-containing protein [Oscillospiraceae bacterium]